MSKVQLARLPDSQQEVVRLRIHAGLSYRQIAEVTGLTVTNVGLPPGAADWESIGPRSAREDAWSRNTGRSR